MKDLPRSQTAQTCVSAPCSAWDLPLFELGIQDPVGEALPANPDAFQDSVTPQLMEDQEGIHHTWKEQGHPTY